MALSPKDLALSKTEIREADLLEKKLDVDLRKVYLPGADESRVFIGRLIQPRIAHEIVRRYMGKGGWQYIQPIRHGFIFKPKK